MFSWFGYTEVVSFLIESGAKLNIKDRFENTALIFASKYGYTKIVKVLLENNADVNAKDRG